MIYATYKLESETQMFFVIFANTQDIWPKYKAVNAIYHLENAVRKAISDSKVKSFQIKVADPKNQYLKILALAFVQFLKGQGFEKIYTEGF